MKDSVETERWCLVCCAGVAVQCDGDMSEKADVFECVGWSVAWTTHARCLITPACLSVRLACFGKMRVRKGRSLCKTNKMTKIVNSTFGQICSFCHGHGCGCGHTQPWPAWRAGVGVCVCAVRLSTLYKFHFTFHVRCTCGGR